MRGWGWTPVTAHGPTPLARLAVDAATGALTRARVRLDDVDALVVGNMCSPVLQRQSQVAALVATELQTTTTTATRSRCLETITTDAACGSGGAAVRLGSLLVRSGAARNVLVVGVERMTPLPLLPASENTPPIPQTLAQASHWDEEGSAGQTFVSLNSQLTRAYIERYNVDPDDFFGFARNAHANAVTAPHALLRKPVSKQTYASSKTLAPFIRLFDACPVCDGAAAVVLSQDGVVGQDVVLASTQTRTDSLSMRRRQDVLELRALREASAAAFAESSLSLRDVGVFEAHDAYSVMTALCLESVGFAAPGEAVGLARAGDVELGGRVPISTFGGLKARGHPVGASGVYQVAEIAAQLTGEAGDNQVRSHPKAGLAVSLGGAATTVAVSLLCV